MAPVDDLLRKYNLPPTPYALVLFEHCSDIKPVRNKFPHSSLEFTSEVTHTLISFSDEGVSEALEVIYLEFGMKNYNSPENQLLEAPNCVIVDYTALKRYESVTVGNKIYFEFSDKLTEDFILHRKAFLGVYKPSRP